MKLKTIKCVLPALALILSSPLAHATRIASLAPAPETEPTSEKADVSPTNVEKQRAALPKSIKIFGRPDVTNTRPIAVTAPMDQDRLTRQDGELSPNARSSVAVGLSFPLSTAKKQPVANSWE